MQNSQPLSSATEQRQALGSPHLSRALLLLRRQRIAAHILRQLSSTPTYQAVVNKQRAITGCLASHRHLEHLRCQFLFESSKSHGIGVAPLPMPSMVYLG